MAESTSNSPKSLVILPGGGRRYEASGIAGTFLADGAETGDRFSVSEWRLDPNSEGVHLHSHDDALELFYVTTGVPRFLIGTERVDAPVGTFLQIPPGIAHAFSNPTDQPAAVLNVKIPGGFERDVARWYGGG